jgi:hypothetical protein
MSRKPSRIINVNQIISFYDQFGERISVLSYRRWNKKKIMELRNINVFQALKEITLRNTLHTISLVAIDLPINIEKYKEVKKFELVIHDYFYGSPKEDKTEDKKEGIVKKERKHKQIESEIKDKDLEKLPE